METGSVKWFNAASGHGFIAPDSGENDLFVRTTSVVGDDPVALIAGERVEFHARVAGMGPEAIDVIRPRSETPRRLFRVATRSRARSAV
jgi:CspA family cold shock protein